MEMTDMPAKRAANMVWTAADDYEIRPFCLFYEKSGQPSLYRNTLEGLGYRCLEENVVLPFLRGIQCGADPEKYLTLVFLSLEEYIAGQMKEERPSLSALREEFAKQRLQELGNPVRYHALAVERQEILHWEWVCRRENITEPVKEEEMYPLIRRDFPEGKRYAEREASLFWALHHAGCLSSGYGPERTEKTDESWVSDIKKILWKYYMYHFLPARREEKSHFLGAGMLLYLFGADSGTFSSKSGESLEESPEDAAELPESRFKKLMAHMVSKTTASEDREYVRNSFGPSMLTASEGKAIAERCCRGLHEGCQLWFARASSSQSELGEEQHRQAEKNLACYQKREQIYDQGIRRITDRLRHALEIWHEPDIVCSGTGSLIAGRVYRVKACRDMRIFRRELLSHIPDFTVDLWLDASSSRVQEQESIAIQAYMVTKSLLQLGIPVQVMGFRSMRSCSIIQQYKAYDETVQADGIFQYYAAGSNRDGLIFRALPVFWEKASASGGKGGRKRIVLVLTDAVPADEKKAKTPDRFPGEQNYEEQLAVEDTAEAIRQLRRKGCRVSAVFWGLKRDVPNLKKMYGDDFIRIRQIDEFPDAVIGLLLRALEDLEGYGA